MKRKSARCLYCPLLLVLMNLASVAYADLNTGLVACYPFNRNANDASGNGHDGTISGASNTADRDGSPNSALFFDGSNDGVSVPSTPSLRVTNWTVTAWTERLGPGYNGHSKPFLILVRKGTSSHFDLSVRGGGGYGAFAEAETEDSWVQSGDSTTVMDSNHWHFVAGTYSTGNGGLRKLAKKRAKAAQKPVPLAS